MTIIPQIALTENTPTVWYGCYDGGWQNIISDLSFRHPAKFSRSLISRIFTYALERGYLKPGDCVLDPFGGVGLGALDALSNGLSWLGCELEKSFHDLGQGCECTGISKADWIRYFGRWDKMAHKDGRHWCPQCLAEAKQVTDSQQLSFFEPDPTAAYVRNSGIIPSTQPHYYRGNLDLFRKYAKPGTWAVLLNGDSRNLRAVIGQAQVDGLVASPPFEKSLHNMSEGGTAAANGKSADGSRRGGSIVTGDYGQTTGQLGAMKPGSLADSLLSSPPYANGCAHTGGADPNPQHIQGGKRGAYGVNYSHAPENLGNLPEGSLADSLLSSPPYINSLERSNGIDADKIKRPGGRNSQSVTDPRYGSSDGQLGAMKEGSLGGLVSSPPYSHPAKTGETKEDSWADGRSRPVGASQRNNGGYGQSAGQLGAMPTTGFDAAVSSPPFAGNTGGRGEASRNGIDAALFDRHSGGMKKGTGDDPGNLDHLPMRGLQDALLSSPPYANSFEGQTDKASRADREKKAGVKLGGGQINHARDYGQTTGQLGIEQGTTFWAAARQIVTESYLALKPGAVTFWVTKRFVRDGCIVNFTDQWRQLCEACGFEFVEHIQAMLIQSESEQGDLNGDVIKTKKKKASFFRRLHEKKFPHLAIDNEDVIVMRKPA